MNSTTAAENMVAINVYEYFNVYQYDAHGLWTTYGIAIACATLCAVLGGFTAWRSMAAFQSNFSTHVRAIAGHNVLKTINAYDEGAEPLPKELAEMYVSLGEER